MRLVGFEAATTSAGVVLADDDEVVGWRQVAPTRAHTEQLLPMVEALLDEADWQLGTIEVVAVDVGPGLFTSLRVSGATAAGLALALGLQVVEVTSTEVLAEAAWARGARGGCVVAVDARRGELFVQRFTLDAEGVTAAAAPALWRPEQLAAAFEQEPGCGVGDGLVAAGLEDQALDPELLGAPPVAALAAVASRRASSAIDPAALRPRYLRPADARVNFEVREPPR